jgi:hypothetical protein
MLLLLTPGICKCIARNSKQNITFLQRHCNQYVWNMLEVEMATERNDTFHGQDVCRNRSAVLDLTNETKRHTHTHTTLTQLFTMYINRYYNTYSLHTLLFSTAIHIIYNTDFNSLQPIYVEYAGRRNGHKPNRDVKRPRCRPALVRSVRLNKRNEATHTYTHSTNTIIHDIYQ